MNNKANNTDAHPDHQHKQYKQYSYRKIPLIHFLIPPQNSKLRKSIYYKVPISSKTRRAAYFPILFLMQYHWCILRSASHLDTLNSLQDIWEQFSFIRLINRMFRGMSEMSFS